uniref:ETFB lysine methyltransferase n=1 Tax=Plectus sambesii TaxID=2011161 RepID=A0A914VAT2_9BILA
TVITEQCPLWMATPDQCPLPDPYWAFYWPGGQALTRFILDNGSQFRDKSVLDFGCGCGASTIAAVTAGARTVFCNDIDNYALLATAINCRRNNVPMSTIEFSNENFLLSERKITPIPDAILLGDMFYDTDFAGDIFRLLRRLQLDKPEMDIFVGDPDRHPLNEEVHRKRIGVQFERELLIDYPLPGYVTREHYGFSSAKVYRLLFV